MTEPTVSLYDLRTATGRHIRMATEVRWPGGDVVRFMDRMPKAEALRQARIVLVRRMINQAQQAHKHTDECLAYAASTGKAFCISECRDGQRLCRRCQTFYKDATLLGSKDALFTEDAQEAQT
jgi:hypothetical protein